MLFFKFSVQDKEKTKITLDVFETQPGNVECQSTVREGLALNVHWKVGTGENTLLNADDLILR